MSPAAIRGIAVLLAASLILGLGFAAGYRWLALDFAKYREAQAEALVRVQEEARQAEKKLRDEMAQVDQRNTQELADAHAENDALRSDLSSARRRLRVAARCPDNATDAGAGGVGDAGTPEFAESARQDYMDFRAAYLRQRQQLIYLQEFIRQNLWGQQ
ncbi:lysis system i-spanin subunit Rz [Alloalcanivorax xenomutans]